MGDIKRITKILIFIFFISLFASCSNDIQYNQNQDAWNGNWYGYIGDTFYKLSFNGDTACLYYSSSYGYRPLYEATIYESTLTLVFNEKADGIIYDNGVLKDRSSVYVPVTIDKVNIRGNLVKVTFQVAHDNEVSLADLSKYIIRDETAAKYNRVSFTLDPDAPEESLRSL